MRTAGDLSIHVVGLLRSAQIAVPSRAAADEILSALDLGDPPTARITTLGLSSRCVERSLLWLIAFVPALVCLAWRAPVGIVVLLFLAAWALTIVARINQLANATVTRSGLWIQRLASKPTFVPFASIARAESVGERTVHVLLRDGSKFDLLVGPEQRLLGTLVFGTIGAISSRKTFVAAVEDGIRGADTSRAGRCIDLVPPTPFRSAAMSSDHLWQIVEDVAAPTAVRIQAATMLRATDESAAQRLRVAGDLSGSTGVRVALARIAEHPIVEQQLNLAGSEDFAEEANGAPRAGEMRRPMRAARR